jgi:hypothetical protein
MLDDTTPIVVVALYREGKGVNGKTGAMVQTYIIVDDGTNPIDAVRAGRDAAICGDCLHRGPSADGSDRIDTPRTYGARSCYVNLGQGPRAVADGVRRGIYPVASADDAREIGRGRLVRLGSYGDPAAAPLYVWIALLAESIGRTGYTHQWRNPRFAGLRAYVMASADTPQDRADAVAAGWRTFRVRTADEPLERAEFSCPASEEMGKRITCSACLACGGADGRKGSPAIVTHGTLAARFAPNRDAARRVIRIAAIA